MAGKEEIRECVEPRCGTRPTSARTHFRPAGPDRDGNRTFLLVMLRGVRDHAEDPRDRIAGDPQRAISSGTAVPLSHMPAGATSSAAPPGHGARCSSGAFKESFPQMTSKFLRQAQITGVAGLFIASTLLGGCGSKSATSGPQATPSSSVVATVNGEPITQAQLNKELNRLFGQQVLSSLVDDRLISQEAKRDKVTINETALQAHLAELKKTPQYAALLKTRNMTDADVESYLRRQMQLKQLILRELPEEVKLRMYDQYRQQLVQAHICDILVDKKDDADKIVAQLKAGKDFAQIARENSKDESSKSNGGDLGWVPRDAPLDPALAKVAFTCKINDIVGPIQTRNGWVILKVVGRKETYDQLKSDIEDRLVSMRQGEYMQRLRVKADIKTIFDHSGFNQPTAAESPAPASSSSPVIPAVPSVPSTAASSPPALQGSPAAAASPSAQ